MHKAFARQLVPTEDKEGEEKPIICWTVDFICPHLSATTLTSLYHRCHADTTRAPPLSVPKVDEKW